MTASSTRVSLDFVVWQMAGLPADRPEMIALLEKITASATIFDVLISAGLAGALAAVTIQPIAIAGSLAALVGFASVARSLLRVGASSSGTMSPSARLRVEPR
jgi:hypothetical protein